MTIVIELKSEMMSLKTAKIIKKYMQMSTSLKKFTCWRHVTLLEINSIEGYIFRNVFEWLILSYSFKESNSLLF